jgi:hypothetical protein
MNALIYYKPLILSVRPLRTAAPSLINLSVVSHLALGGANALPAREQD